MNTKDLLRKELLETRANLSEQRRKEAAKSLRLHFESGGSILSFTSIGTEIDTHELNQHLSAQNRLFLVPYQADAAFELPLAKIDCILVPALGFDSRGHRLGYGKGWYDRLLAKAGSFHTIGIGFTEQLCSDLPIDPWDIALKQILLF